MIQVFNNPANTFLLFVLIYFLTVALSFEYRGIPAITVCCQSENQCYLIGWFFSVESTAHNAFQQINRVALLLYACEHAHICTQECPKLNGNQMTSLVRHTSHLRGMSN